MNVKELIEILSNEVKKCDRENAQVEIWDKDEQEYEIESISAFSLSPDVVIKIKPIKSPIIKPATFKKEHTKMVVNTMKRIKKDMKEMMV